MLKLSATQLVGISMSSLIETPSWLDFNQKYLMIFYLPRHVALGVRCRTWRLKPMNRRSPCKNFESGTMRSTFVKQAFLTQVRNGAHAHLEQPMHALSWKTRALRQLPGYFTLLDQCRFGTRCLDSDGLWKLVKKPTAILTTKRFLFNEMSLRCDGGHQHRLLEGSAPGIGRRTQYLEDYQPGLAAVLSACLMFDETPTIMDFVGAVNEEKEQISGIIQLLTNNKADAVRTVQRLHRNLGHPDNKKLTELLASSQRYHKPNSSAPAQISTSTTFNETLQADVFWLKLGEKKFPILRLVDAATRFQAASVVYGERTQDYLHALERGWIRHLAALKS